VTDPEVSVVIPTRNRLEMLQQTLETVLGQQGVDVEVIVIDEGSSDGTPAWLATLDDPRVQFVRHDEPRRLPGARNAGVSRATAPLVAFVDDDDLWSAGKLRAQLDEMRRTGASWSCVGCVHVDEHLEPVAVSHAAPAAEMAELLLRYNAVPGGGSGVVIERSVLEQAGGFDETLNAVEDWECWLRVVAVAGPPATIDRPLLAYRRLSHSMSHEVDRMITALRRVAELHPEIRQDANLGVPAGTIRGMSRLARESGDLRTAARLVWLDRRNAGTLLRAPLYLAVPLVVLRRSFLLRRAKVRWGAPLVAEISRFAPRGSGS
jgi:glycosyltransferase involved in cell wall biosynthesis